MEVWEELHTVTSALADAVQRVKNLRSRRNVLIRELRGHHVPLREVAVVSGVSDCMVSRVAHNTPKGD